MFFAVLIRSESGAVVVPVPVLVAEDGVVGYCQPGGGSPENNYNATTSSDFCVGDFLLAASEMAQLQELQT